MQRNINFSSSVNNSANVLPKFPSNFTAHYGSSGGLIGLTTVTLLFNFAVLVILFKERNLRTAFNVYLIVLLSSNILAVGALNTMNLLTNGFRTWLIGNPACTFNIYNRYVIVPITFHVHALIGLNRAWALFRPISYKRHHTYKVAWLICLIMVIYVHIIEVPGVALDALYYRLPLEKGCWVNRKAQFTWHLFGTIVTYDVPKLTMPFMYPILFWKRLQRRRAAIAIRSSAASTASDSTPQRIRKRRHASRPFVLLTLLTISTVVCWIPGLVYFALLDYYPASQFETLNSIQMIVYPLQALMDPILWCISISSLGNYISGKTRITARRINCVKPVPMRNVRYGSR